MNNDKRESVKQWLKMRFEANLEERIDRALQINSRWFVPKHHFSGCLVECINSYIDGYFVVAAMSVQAVNEGLIRFIEERNGLSSIEDRIASVEELHNRGIITKDIMEASKRILHSFRNDFHHMNPNVSNIPIKDIAKRNIEDLCLIENEIFGCEYTDKGLRPKQRKYWDISKDGTIEIVAK